MAYTTINKSTDYFNTKLYTGNGGTQSISGLSFQPDWTWIKSRTSTHNNQSFDALRGVQKALVVNEGNAEFTMTNGLTAFGTDGFTVGSDDQVNNSSQNYVSWNWLGANGTASNSNGSITSTVSANTTAGFSVVKWQGSNVNATIGHGLTQAPSLIFIKNTTGYNWYTYHKKLGATKTLVLNEAEDKETQNYFQDTDPTNQVFYVGSTARVNGGSTEMIAYCFHDVTGYSKVNSYVGNGADTQFIYLGFKPAFFLWKSWSDNDHWGIIDNKRDTFNDTYGHELQLRPNSDSAELDGTGDRGIDFLSNGVCLRGWASATGTVSANQSGHNYMYYAVASAPLVGSNNVPCTAR